MTTMPFPTTTGISAAYDQGSAQVHQHLTAALGALGQMDASVHGAIDMLNSEIAALRAFLQQAANTPGISATEALQLLQLEDAVNQAQTQTTTPAQAATASTGLRDLVNRMFGRPAGTPIVPAAPIPAGYKSVAFSLTLRSDDGTLTDDHAEEAVRAVLDALRENFGAVLALETLPPTQIDKPSLTGSWISMEGHMV